MHPKQLSWCAGNHLNAWFLRKWGCSLKKTWLWLMGHGTSSLPADQRCSNQSPQQLLVSRSIGIHPTATDIMGSRWGLHPSRMPWCHRQSSHPPQFCYTLSLIQWSNHSGSLSKCILGVVALRGWTWWFVSLPIWQFNVLRSRKSYLLGDPKKMHQNLKYSCLSNTMQGFAQWTIILSDHSSAHINFILHAYFIAWCMGGALSSLDG